ncbi:MAG: deoxyribose-phosphate aldolase [Planctomycetaceae bacterium]|jgi:deoxyribose-phosphate aldolase|nr:deoxyribose-phosphate aldolase [Phycisphaerales bacterium]MCE2652240.1 deoxyribose-phosphate aldolase [Planctomycetaceae bacterium]
MPTTTVDKVMAEHRAASFTKRSIKADAKLAGLRLAASMVDLTTLEGKDSPEKVRGLCRKAVCPGDGRVDCPPVAAVCVYPSLVAVARKELDKYPGNTVKIAAVATGFPSGQYPIGVRLEDTRRAVEAGADEIDMVISRGAFLAGDHRRVHEEIIRTVEACGPAHLKVILETGELETLDNVRAASDLAIDALSRSGAVGGFIKTSTGKVEPAATMPVTLVMLEAIRDHYLATGEVIGMKPAGGIRTAKQALHYLVMLKETLGVVDPRFMTPQWFRFGASALLNDLLRQMDWLARGKYAARYDFGEA